MSGGGTTSGRTRASSSSAAMIDSSYRRTSHRYTVRASSTPGQSVFPARTGASSAPIPTPPATSRLEAARTTWASIKKAPNRDCCTSRLRRTCQGKRPGPGRWTPGRTPICRRRLDVRGDSGRRHREPGGLLLPGTFSGADIPGKLDADPQRGRDFESQYDGDSEFGADAGGHSG